MLPVKIRRVWSDFTVTAIRRNYDMSLIKIGSNNKGVLNGILLLCVFFIIYLWKRAKSLNIA